MKIETFEPELKDFVKLHDIIDRLKVALKFYSNSENWEYTKTDCTNSAEYVPVHEDKGRVAILALKNN
jgi:hypothetical protein